jgi:hypothetical protein
MSSQYWGETLAEIEADHFAQIGWKLTPGTMFDALGLYAFVVSRLGDLQRNAPGWSPRTVATMSSTAPRDAG